MADPDTGMERGEMRKLLVASKRQPVSCGIGMGKDGALLMLDKTKPPRMLTKDLEKKFPDMKQPHWGTAMVDLDVDPKLVILTLNKAAPGMARRLKKTLKGTGFSKVEIRLEDGTVADKAAEEEEEEEAPGKQPFQRAAPDAPPAPGATGPAQPEADTAAPPAPPAPEAASAAPGQPAAPGGVAKADAEIAALTKQLAGLIRDIITVAASDPNSAGALKQQAVAAQTAIKAHDVAASTAEIGKLKNAIEDAAKATQAAPAGAPGAPDAKKMAALSTARKAWGAARGKIKGDLDKLHQTMQAAYQDHPFGDQLDKLFETKVGPVLDSLDEKLAHKLDELTSSTEPGTHAKLLTEARQILDGYSAYVAGEPLIAKLDQNPFVPLKIGPILTATLSALEKTIQ